MWQQAEKWQQSFEWYPEFGLVWWETRKNAKVAFECENLLSLLSFSEHGGLLEPVFIGAPVSMVWSIWEYLLTPAIGK